MRGLVGILALLAIAFAPSEARRDIPWRVVIGGILLQVAIATLFLELPPAIAVLVALDHAVGALQSATEAGTTLVFGFRPLVWLIGIPWDQSAAASGLMGTKTVLNEFVAYLDLSHLPAGTLDAHARLVMTYALCGFANFGSLGILLGGMTAMAPERRADIVALGWRSLVSGTLASLMSGAVVGLIV